MKIAPYVGSMNDAAFVIDGPPSPAPYDGPVPKTYGPQSIWGPIPREHVRTVESVCKAIREYRWNSDEIERLRTLNGEMVEALREADAVIDAGFSQAVCMAHGHADLAREHGQRIDAWRDRARAILAKMENEDGENPA